MVSTRVQKTEFELSSLEQVDGYEYIIRYLYSQEDISWFKTCHKSGGNRAQAVADALASISPNAEFYTLLSPDGEIAAFFVKTAHEGKLVMEGFHISKNFRTAEFINTFWREVRRVFADEFYIGIFVGNTAAFNHLIRNGFEFTGEAKVDGKNFFLLQNKLI